MIAEQISEIEPREDRVMFSRGFSFLSDQPVAQNRLVQVNILNAQPATVADNIEMTYDGFGRRVSILEQHGTMVLTAKTFVWCGAELCQQRDPTGHTVTNQFFASGEVISGTNYYYAKDHLGNIREMTDASGVVHANYDYDPFGRQTKLSGDLDADFGYTGMYVERAAVLDLTWFRAYDPGKGRWLSRDPMGEGTTGMREGLNLYAMVIDNPLEFTDLFGLCGNNQTATPTAVPSSALTPATGNSAPVATATPDWGKFYNDQGDVWVNAGMSKPQYPPSNIWEPGSSPSDSPSIYFINSCELYAISRWKYGYHPPTSTCTTTPTVSPTSCPTNTPTITPSPTPPFYSGY